jgi:Papain-like cysteine protease AvrRpt2
VTGGATRAMWTTNKTRRSMAPAGDSRRQRYVGIRATPLFTHGGNCRSAPSATRSRRPGSTTMTTTRTACLRTTFPKRAPRSGSSAWRGAFASTLVDDFEALGLLIEGYGPLWCAFAKPSAHVVVVTGVDSQTNTIHIANPWAATGLMRIASTSPARLQTSAEHDRLLGVPGVHVGTSKA